MSNLVTENWLSKERCLPGINCIVYPDGTITILRHYESYNPNTKETKYFCNPVCDTTIDSLIKYDAEYWTRVDEWTNIEYRGGKIYGGDGSMGNEGFIACVDADDHLLWGIFFEHTNPIKSLSISDKTLIAINEHSEIQVDVNLNELTDIKIKSLVNE
jgi:hypothetical protein